MEAVGKDLLALLLLDALVKVLDVIWDIAGGNYGAEEEEEEEEDTGDSLEREHCVPCLKRLTLSRWL